MGMSNRADWASNLATSKRASAASIVSPRGTAAEAAALAVAKEALAAFRRGDVAEGARLMDVADDALAA